MLPNFLCIGAQKCGTTSLWKILSAHPDVFLASPRETQFFHDDLQFADGIQCYEYRYFSGWRGQPAVGEKCPEYLYVPGVARRIHDTLGPDVRFLVTIRSPAQRAFSHYRHNLTALRELRSFEEALEDEAGNLAAGRCVPAPFGYLGRGRYAEQLQRFLEYFDRDQFLIVDFDTDICSDQRALTHRLYGFLGLPRFFPAELPFAEGRPRLDQLQVRLDDNSHDPRDHFVEITRHRRSSRVKRWLRPLTGRGPSSDVDRRRILQPSPALKQFARSFAQHRPESLHLSRDQELAINRQYFDDDVRQLQALVSTPLNGWLTDDSETADTCRAEAAA